MKAKLTPEEYNNLVSRVRSDNPIDSARAGEHLLFAIREYLIGFSYTFFKRLDQDSLTEALFKIWNKLDLYDIEKSSFPTWATAIFKHRMYRNFNNKKKRKNVEQLNGEIFDDAMLNVGVYQDEFELEGAPDILVDTISIVESNPKFRMLYMHYICGLTYDELSEVLDIPIHTVKNNMARQRKKLRELMLKTI